MRWSLTVVVYAALSANAFALPIMFTHTGRGSGTIDDMAFSDADFTVTALGATENRNDETPGLFFINHDSSSIAISGVGVLQFVTPTRTFVNSGVTIVGFSRAGFSGLDLFNGPANQVFGSWDMLSSVGPIDGTANLLQWLSSPVVTDAGVLVFSSGSSNGTFKATIVPEPTSMLLMAIGALAFGLCFCLRRQGKRA